MPDRAYAAHERLVAPARAHGTIGRFVIGLVVIGLLTFGLNSVLQVLIVQFAPGLWQSELANPMVQGTSPLSMLILLASFGFVTLGVLFATAKVHKRAALGVFGPLALALSQFLHVLAYLVVIGIVLMLLPPYGMDGTLQLNLAPMKWAMLLPLSLLAVLIQTSAEEVLFRGYIQQQLAARFASPLIWMVFPAVVFALGHYLPAQAGENALPIALWAGLFGVLMADLTARSGTLGPAMAVHFANNVSSLLFISLPDSLNGLALFTVPFSMADTAELRAWLPVDLGLMIVSWLAARVAIRR